ncbi:MAG: methyltransferase domain-containing protein [Candidatus Paceibacterota bacterium]
MRKEKAKKILRETHANYNRNAEDFSRARQETWNEVHLLSNYITKGDKVLDLGCGNGRYFESIQDKDVDYLGIDFSEELIQIARKKYSEQDNAEFRTGDVLDLDLSKNQFDLVYAFALLHHIPSNELRARFLKQAKEILKPNGKIILTVWNVWNFKKKRIIKSNLLKIIGLSDLDFNDITTSFGGLDEVYVHCFREKELVNLLENMDFKVKKSGYLKRGNKEKANIFAVAKVLHNN